MQIQKKKFDINKWIWRRKKKFFNFPINFIATSRWQEKNLKNSHLFNNHNIELIPLPLDSENWFPINKKTAREILKLDKNKKTILISWHVYPLLKINSFFENKIIELNIKKNDELFFICRSGGRSFHAAKFLAHSGYNYCYNVSDGFEGDKNKLNKRSTINGWKFNNLPWEQ